MARPYSWNRGKSTRAIELERDISAACARSECGWYETLSGREQHGDGLREVLQAVTAHVHATGHDVTVTYHRETRYSKPPYAGPQP